MIEWFTTRLFGDRIASPHYLPSGALPPDVVLRSGRLIPRLGGWLGRMRGSAAAVTLRRTIFIHPDTRLTRSLLAHELAHVRQWGDDPLFPIRYSLATLRYGYRDNPYEVEARAVAHSANLTQSDEDATLWRSTGPS